MAVTKMDTYTQVGAVEEVSDIVSLISPTKTPALTLFGSEPTDNTYFQWQEDALDAVAVNAQVEGAAAIAANMNPTTMRTGNTQIFEKTVSVSGSAQRRKMHGTTNEFNRQLAKKSKEIKLDMEHALVGLAQAGVAGDSVTARKLTGVQIQHVAGAIQANGGTPRAFSETLLLAAGEAAYNAGAEPTILMIKPADAKIVSAMAAATGRHRDMDDMRKIVNVVDVYVCPYGEYKVVLNRVQRTSDALLLDPSMWKLRPFRAWQTEKLAKTGDSDQSMLLGEYGLSNKNYASGINVRDLS